jgi:hypothetical protein
MWRENLAAGQIWLKTVLLSGFAGHIGGFYAEV